MNASRMAAVPRARWLVVVAIALAVGAASASASPFLGVKWSSRTMTLFGCHQPPLRSGGGRGAVERKWCELPSGPHDRRSRVNVVVSASRSIRQCGAGAPA